MSPLKLTQVLYQDSQLISDFVNSVYRGEEATKSWTSEASFISGQRTDRKMIESILADPNQQILRNSSDPLKCCIHLRKDGDAVWFGMITVKLAEQGTGIGKQLVSEAEKYVLETLQIKSIRMNVIAFREELIRWYERRGYSRSEVRSPFPYGDSRFGIPLRNDIDFMIMTKSLVQK